MTKKKHKNDRIFNDDLNTSIKENSYKKESITPSSIREPDLDFRNLVDKLDQAEIT